MINRSVSLELIPWSSVEIFYTLYWRFHRRNKLKFVVKSDWQENWKIKKLKSNLIVSVRDFFFYQFKTIKSILIESKKKKRKRKIGSN